MSNDKLINHEDGLNIISALENIKSSYGHVIPIPTMENTTVPYIEGVVANVLDYIDGFDASKMIAYGDITASDYGTYTCHIALKSKNDEWYGGSKDAIELEWIHGLPAADVSWATASDEALVTLIQMADEGKIDLAEDYGWAVGDERVVHLSAMSNTGVGESQPEQDVVFVLMHKGLYKDANDNTVNFIVGLKDCLNTIGYINSTNTNTVSWDGCSRRAWCNNIFYNSLPSTFKSLFKQFKTVTAQTYNGSTNQTSIDYFALPAEGEVLGSWAHSNKTEFNALTQFDYYKTSTNRIKKLGSNGSANAWWERSIYQGGTAGYCAISVSGSSKGAEAATNTHGIAPFGCI